MAKVCSGPSSHFSEMNKALDYCLEIKQGPLQKGGAKSTVVFFFLLGSGMLFCSRLCSGFGGEDLGDVPSCWLSVGVTAAYSLLIRLYVLCVKSCRLLNCLFSLLLVHLSYFAWEFFPSKQMNLLINVVTFLFCCDQTDYSSWAALL